MLKYIVAVLVFLFPVGSYACITCNKQIQEAIFNSTFYPNLIVMLSAFIVLFLLVMLLSFLATKRHRATLAKSLSAQQLNPVPLTTAATVLGIGVGGFIDGVVLHQLLQWHEMLSNKMPPITLVAKSVNMFWDGVFHAFCLIVTLVGVILLWKLLGRNDVDKSGRLLGSGLLVGWALFNLVEGVIDHHLLKLHNVREITAHPLAWNFGFLAFSIILLGVGFTWAGSKTHAQDTAFT